VTFKGELRPFQSDAVRFMLQRRNVLVAHALGLGKTVTSIAAVESLIDSGIANAVLVICPASVKWQWAKQIEKFTDGALVLVIEGTKIQRMQQYRLIHQGKVEYVLMNYEQIVNDWHIIRLLKFDVIIADECQAIKNPGAKRTRHIKRLGAQYKYGLTGQPMENKPEEAFSIMEWINPQILGRFDIFDRTFIVRNKWGQARRHKNLRLFREQMKPAMHRRSRDDVADQMPKIVEQSYLIDMDPRTLRLYREIARQLIVAIKEVGPRFNSFDVWNHYSGWEKKNGSGYAEIMPRLMAMRMLCDHPQLLRLSADNFDDQDTKLGSEYAAHLRDTGKLDGITATPKLTVTLEVIDEILDANPKNKVVLFSFFKPMLAIIQREMRVKSVLFTGDLTARQKETSRQEFLNDPECRVFLSSDAGGVGVDLPIANYLFSYDLPWSAGKWEQRNGRIDRLSSEWPEITLLSMLMHGSIEERMYDMVEQKGRISSAWLDGKGVDSRGDFKLSLGSLVDFLQKSL
jgi:SNF2 family DNA or RNA helicase